jgi:hypothetical protein
MFSEGENDELLCDDWSFVGFRMNRNFMRA